MNLAKIKAVVAGLGYLAIVSLAAYNLRGQLFGSSVPSASANSTPVATAPVAATPEPAAQSASSSGSAGAQSDLKTPQQASQPPLKTEKPAAPGKQASTQEKTSARAQQSLVPVAGNGSVAAGERLPDFLLTGLNGNTLNESTLRGHKTLFIIVSPTCPHCQKELKLLHEIQNDYPSIEPVFASVFPLNDTRPLADMTGEGDHIYTGARDLATSLGVTGVPFLMLIDEKGIVRAIRKGELQEPDFRDILGRFARGEQVPQVSQLRSWPSLPGDHA
ncbi:MAG TPA: TlpA disulfide reductase family protein [Terriglobales bacterium]|nr:TlpA disulfide reductase family protein [Terriglobales bacterium]